MDDRIPEGEACGPEGCGPDARGAGERPTPLGAESPSTGPVAGVIDVVSDAICPWCWIGKRQLGLALEELAADGLRFEVRWRPFQLNPDLPPEGVDRRAYRSAKFGSWERSQELDRRVAEAGAAVGLGFRHDLMARTPNTVDAHRLIRLAGTAGRQDAVAEALFRAYFTEGRDIGDRSVLAAVAAEAGMDRERVEAELAGDACREEVLAEDLAARRAGLTGVPSFLLDRHLLFSGAVAAPQMAEAFRRAHTILSRQREAATAG